MRHCTFVSSLLTVLLCAAIAVPAEPKEDGQRLSTSYPDWLNVDSLAVSDYYYVAGTDTAVITVYISNPDPAHSVTTPVQLRVSNPALGYDYLSPVQQVTIPAQSQGTAQFQWADTSAVPFLEYDLCARLLLGVESQQNLAVNGDFESGLAGWTLVNDNPPGYGVERVTIEDGDSDGEAHVYMTQYDTYGIQPEIYQAVTLTNQNSFVHLRFKPVTEDIMWGVGVALVYVKRGPGEYVYWHSTAAKPADTPTRHYVRVLNPVWQNCALTVDQIPGGSGGQLLIGAKAAMQTSMPYAMVEVDIYLDDVGVSAIDPTVLESYAAYIWTGSNTQTIGDYQQALRDCLTETFPDLGVMEHVVPLVSTVHMWDNFSSNMCAAALYQDLPGKARQKDLAMFRATYSLFEGPLEVLSLATQTGAFSVEDILEDGAIAAVEGATLAYVDQEVWGDAQAWNQTKDAVTEIVEAAAEGFRDEVLARGAGALIISAFSPAGMTMKDGNQPYVSVDSLGLMGCWVATVKPDTLTWASVSDRPQVLLAPEPLAPTDPLRFTFTAASTAPVDFLVLHSGSAGTSAVSLDSLMLDSSDVVCFDAAETTEVFQFCIDCSGDGTIDSVIPVPVCAEVRGDPPMSEGRLRIGISPNPARDNVVFTFRIESQQQVTLDVCDVSGRSARRVVDARLLAGLHTVPWDARDACGKPVAPGIYIATLNGSTCRASAKVVLLR